MTKDRFYLDEEGVLQANPPITNREDDPLGLSIEKWEAIVRLLEAGERVANDGATKTCALCRVYSLLVNCNGCPVRKRTGFSYCWETPYEEWCKQAQGDLDPGAMLAAARAELDFLKSLREETDV